jgi:hypothetical protein
MGAKVRGTSPSLQPASSFITMNKISIEDRVTVLLNGVHVAYGIVEAIDGNPPTNCHLDPCIRGVVFCSSSSEAESE